ncbi:MAG: cell division protein ZapA [Clostridiales bacterium]|nr:cell division protein ZapA [Clostridiales bacterium]
MKQVFRVTVAGLPLNIVTDEEEEYLLSLTDKLSRVINDIVLNNKSASKIDAALLCALDGMDQAHKLTAEVDALKEENLRLLAENEKYRRKNHGKHA